MRRNFVNKVFTIFITSVMVFMLEMTDSYCQRNESNFRWGFTVGYNQVFHYMDYNLPVSPDTLRKNGSDTIILSQNFGNGIGYGYSVGLVFEYLFSSSSALIKLTFDNLPTRIVEQGRPETIIYDFGAECKYIVNMPTEHILDVKYQLLTFDALFKTHFLFEGFGIMLGPDISYILNTHIKQSHEISLPPLPGMSPDTSFMKKWVGKGYAFGSEKITKVYRDEDIPNLLNFRFGLKGGIFFEFKFDNFWLSPGLIYDFGITHVDDGEDWTVHTLKILFDVKI